LGTEARGLHRRDGMRDCGSSGSKGGPGRRTQRVSKRSGPRRTSWPQRLMPYQPPPPAAGHTRARTSNSQARRTRTSRPTSHAAAVGIVAPMPHWLTDCGATEAARVCPIATARAAHHRPPRGERTTRSVHCIRSSAAAERRGHGCARDAMRVVLYVACCHPQVEVTDSESLARALSDSEPGFAGPRTI
jgi:hypothetical protein